MRKKFFAALSLPLMYLMGWMATRFSEAYERSIDQLEFDFDDIE